MGPEQKGSGGRDLASWAMLGLQPPSLPVCRAGSEASALLVHFSTFRPFGECISAGNGSYSRADDGRAGESSLPPRRDITEEQKAQGWEGLAMRSCGRPLSFGYPESDPTPQSSSPGWGARISHYSLAVYCPVPEPLAPSTLDLLGSMPLAWLSPLGFWAIGLLCRILLGTTSRWGGDEERESEQKAGWVLLEGGRARPGPGRRGGGQSQGRGGPLGPSREGREGEGEPPDLGGLGGGEGGGAGQAEPIKDRSHPGSGPAPQAPGARPGMAPAPAHSRRLPWLPGALLLLLVLLLASLNRVLARPAPLQPDSALKEDGPWLEDVPKAAASKPILPMQAAPQWATAQGRPRCGVPNLPRGLRLQNRQKRFVLSGGRWEKVNLTYRIMRFPWQLVKEQVQQMMAEALRVWSNVTPLTFTEVQEGRADIMIDFTRYWHGDNLPFDGPGGILAHAFFPKTHREGDVHFDYDETWTIGNNLGTDLLQVAAHEFGHVLGLQHSNEAKALMSPFYTFRYPLSLSPDDQQGIQHLYGQRLVPSPEPHPTLAPPAPGPTRPHPKAPPPPQPGDIDTNEISLEPDACDTDFDAAATIRGELFFFKSGFVWRLRAGQLQPGYPALASRHWQGLPTSLDAAFEDPQGNIWFFQGLL
ncbi:stromelysin-3-like [Vombatus ursinus]|uniref:stromelysin-3-like n=1 Tax=Vombatus ursinus TaxID=29139 RepID=UPI000FFD498A|nr:stromelysin-3-like [Vombatus ursinus]